MRSDDRFKKKNVQGGCAMMPEQCPSQPIYKKGRAKTRIAQSNLE